MKSLFQSVVLASVIAFSLSSCEKDEGKLPDISLKTGTGYTSTDATVATGSDIMIGIEAEKTEDEDVLKKFNISKSVNGATSTTVLDSTLAGAQGDEFNYDFHTTVGSTAGDTEKYTFTVTNRDGLTGQTSVTITLQ
jgi:hypothetical protein